MASIKKISLLTLSALALAGCGGLSISESITITIWEDSSNVEMVQELVKEYLENYKNSYPDGVDIVVQFEEKSEKSAIETMATVAAAGQGPDIAAVTHDTISQGVADQLLARVSYSEEVKARMTPEAVKAVTYEGAMYGYPITAESMVILYDKTKISASEIASFDALKESGKKICWALTGDDGGYYTSGLYTDSVIFGEDGTDPTKVDLATPKAIANVYSFFHDYADCLLDATPEQAVSYVTNNVENACGLMSSPFILASMRNALGEKLGIAKLPTINGESERPFSGYKAYAVSKYSKHPQIAQDLCNFLTSYDAMDYRLEMKGYLPACPLDATEDIASFISQSTEAHVFAESLADSYTMPNIPRLQSYWRPMNNANTSFYNSRAELTKEAVKSALEDASKTIKG